MYRVLTVEDYNTILRQRYQLRQLNKKINKVKKQLVDAQNNAASADRLCTFWKERYEELKNERTTT